MRTSTLVAFTASALFAAGCTVPMTGAPASNSKPTSAPSGTSRYSASESRIFDLINAERRSQGLQPLVFNSQLDRMAKIQAENMARFQ